MRTNDTSYRFVVYEVEEKSFTNGITTVERIIEREKVRNVTFFVTGSGGRRGEWGWV